MLQQRSFRLGWESAARFQPSLCCRPEAAHHGNKASLEATATCVTLHNLKLPLLSQPPHTARRRRTHGNLKATRLRGRSNIHEGRYEEPLGTTSRRGEPRTRPRCRVSAGVVPGSQPTTGHRTVHSLSVVNHSRTVRCPVQVPDQAAGARLLTGRAVGHGYVGNLARPSLTGLCRSPQPLGLQLPRRHYSSQQQGPTTGPNPQQQHHHHHHGNGQGETPPSLGARMLESAATSFASILVLAAGFSIAAFAYHKSYKRIVLAKMENAFKPGDPVLELAAMGKGMPGPFHPKSGKGGSEDEWWIPRPEQETVDKIVSGLLTGHYYLLLGEKGTGKSSMLLEAMRKIDGEGVAMFEAHADLEIFRIRLGKALDYEFHEDYIGGYFSERGPRDTTALLDIERALNKLEKVALKRRQKSPGRPLILIINQMHLVRDDEDGKDLFELLQQRAEQWAAANLVTMVFNSDDYWVYERFKQLATRLEVLSVTDLPKSLATDALKRYRQRYFREVVPDALAEAVYDTVGGRLSFLNRVAKSDEMLATCKKIVEMEKTWFLNQCWILGAEMDDDVMDQQKWAAAAMVLVLGLVDKEPEMDQTYDPIEGHVLPSFALHEAQELMTRADFVRAMDRLNLFTITSSAQVRASSVPMHIAFRQICAQDRFRSHLEATIQRISDIESLGRTREIVAKDLVLGGRYEIEAGVSGGGGGFFGGGGGKKKVVVRLVEEEKDDKDEKEDDRKEKGKE